MLPLRIMKMGRWWKQNVEIDIVATDTESKDFLFGECKYSNTPVDIGTLVQLQEKSAAFQVPGERYFVLFSKSGFTPRLVKYAADHSDVFLFALEDIIVG